MIGSSKKSIPLIAHSSHVTESQSQVKSTFEPSGPSVPGLIPVSVA